MSTQPGNLHSTTRAPDYLTRWLEGSLEAAYHLGYPTTVALRVLDLLDQLHIVSQDSSPDARAILAYDLSTAEGQDFLVEYLGDWRAMTGGSGR